MKVEHTVLDDQGNGVSTATVTGRIQQGGTDIVAGVSWPVVFTYEGAGVYSWTYPDSVRTALLQNQTYVLIMEASTPGIDDDIVSYSEIILRVKVDCD